MRSLASGKAVTQFSVATNEYIGQGKEKAEYHNIVTWVTRPLGRTRHPRPASRA
jgi:single-stranded DNA-binding protein